LHSVVCPRAPRYSIDVPLRFRRPDDAAWRQGRTVNASRTGVAFRTPEGELPTGCVLLMEFALPGTLHPASVECSGTVVRCESSEAGETAIAMTIEDYRFAGGIHRSSSTGRGN
jgi:PilZ domain